MTGKRIDRNEDVQDKLPLYGHGGTRRGAGRPRDPNSGVPHLTRAPMTRHQPVHVTARMLDIRSLRRGPCFRMVRRALAKGCMRKDFRVTEFSVMSNHIHLICEADERRALARGLQGLLIRLARALNRHLERKGKVFTDRYHDHVLRTPREVRNALAYVVNNARRHAAQGGHRYPWSWTDPCSSADEFFDLAGPNREAPPMPPARCWLLKEGWRRAGPVGRDEVPGRGGGSQRRPG